MADCALIPWRITAVTARNVILSGTVKDGDGNGLQRRVIVYRNGIETEVVGSALSSAGTGAFAITCNGNHNDVFRVIALGEPGEYSQILDRVQED